MFGLGGFEAALRVSVRNATAKTASVNIDHDIVILIVILQPDWAKIG
jgi:hypothetical protein